MPSKTRGQLTKADRAKASKGIKARAAAIKELQERHKGEFDELLVQHRMAAGLAPRNNGPSKAQLEARVRKAEERLAKDRDLLRLVS
jgi:hypothetical protein